MFNKKFINVLLKISGWATIVAAAIFFISGFFEAADLYGHTAKKIGFWFSYEAGGLVMIAFVYALIGVMFRLNNK